MDFANGAELLALCESRGWAISAVMHEREITEGGMTAEQAEKKMRRALSIMRQSAMKAAEEPRKSMGGLIGGESALLRKHSSKGGCVSGTVASRAAAYALSVLEINASMGLIVAAPTAGSAGVVPGVLLSLQDEYDFSGSQMIDALWCAGAVGYLAMRNANVAGAVCGCQAEVGVAAAMAAAAACELLGGTAEQCLDAGSIVLMNMLGLVCDPVGGLVEYPCQIRNTSGVANALMAVDLVMSGIKPIIPFDEMLAAMYSVGRKIPVELRETALGGCATTPTARNLCCGCSGCTGG